MIIEFILNTVTNVIQSVLGILPDLPAMPAWITDYTDILVSIITAPLEIMAYILTPAILIFVLTTTLVVFNFEIVYHAVMWVVRKLPFSSH